LTLEVSEVDQPLKVTDFGLPRKTPDGGTGFGENPGKLRIDPLGFSGYVIPFGKHTKSYGKSPFLMDKSTISMAIFNSYVSLPEGSFRMLIKVQVAVSGATT
jgi:hypothetical protein